MKQDFRSLTQKIANINAAFVAASGARTARTHSVYEDFKRNWAPVFDYVEEAAQNFKKGSRTLRLLIEDQGDNYAIHLFFATNKMDEETLNKMKSEGLVLRGIFGYPNLSFDGHVFNPDMAYALRPCIEEWLAKNLANGDPEHEKTRPNSLGVEWQFNPKS